MRTDVTWLDLRLRRRMLVGSMVGMALYTFVVVAIFPAFKGDTSLNTLTQDNPTMAALFGATGSLTSVEGWLSANLYANFVPLVAMVLTIGYGASALAGQDEDGTLGLLATLPMSRLSILLQKTTVLVLLAVAVPAATFACVLLGPQFELHPRWSAVVGTSVGVVLLALDLGLLALLVGAVTGSRGTALGVASGVAAAAYLISSLAPVVHWVHSIPWVSLFYWAVGKDQLTVGLGWGDLAVLGGAGLVLLALTVPAFARLDVR